MDDVVQGILNEYDKGKPIFDSLFTCDSCGIVSELEEIFKMIESDDVKKCMSILNSKHMIKKVLHDDEPHEISICYYDAIIINAFGVYYEPEHGSKRQICNMNVFRV